MTNDLPDWTRKVIIEYTGGFIGLEELATRLGFIAPFNLQGNLVLMEDFETELTEWIDGSAGGVSAITRQSLRKYSGNWAVKMLADNVGGALAEIDHYLHFPGTVKCGVFCRVAWKDDCQHFDFAVEIHDGAEEIDPGIYYDYPTTTLGIITPGPVLTPLVPLIDVCPAFLTWIPIMFTYDLSTLTYDKLYISDQEYDISAYGLHHFGSVDPLYQMLWARASATGGVGFTMYIDDMVLVKNVP